MPSRRLAAIPVRDSLKPQRPQTGREARIRKIWLRISGKAAERQRVDVELKTRSGVGFVRGGDSLLERLVL